MKAVPWRAFTRSGSSSQRFAVTHVSTRRMATHSSIPHEDRTASEPRSNQLEAVRLAHIREINNSVRLLRLQAIDPNHTIQFLPGQWLDTFIPGIPKAGGFTITSSPSEARPSSHSPPYVELAVQRSRNPPAQWLWRPVNEILDSQLVVRTGGSFTWPPPRLDVSEIERLVLVAGGVGIKSSVRPREIHFVYATKADPDLDPQKILFVPRLLDLVAAEADPNVTFSLYLTGLGDEGMIEHGRLPNRTFGRRITEFDLTRAIDGFRTNVFGAEHDRKNTLCYVCGPPMMTDEFVRFLSQQPGMSQDRVLCEKWW